MKVFDEVNSLIDKIKKAGVFEEEIFILLNENHVQYDSITVLE